jgi:hypothetical protein
MLLSEKFFCSTAIFATEPGLAHIAAPSDRRLYGQMPPAFNHQLLNVPVTQGITTILAHSLQDDLRKKVSPFERFSS